MLLSTVTVPEMLMPGFLFPVIVLLSTVTVPVVDDAAGVWTVRNNAIGHSQGAAVVLHAAACIRL